VTGEDDLERISSAISELEKRSREVDALIDKLNEKKKEVRRLLDALSVPENSSKGKSTSSDSVAREALIKAVSENVKGQKMSTGNGKLDSLLYGGIAPPSNIVLRGPPFSGKFIIANNFVAQSLRDGIPVIVLSADKDIVQMKESLSKIAGDVEKAEESGLLRFIDAYSRSIQAEVGSKHAVQVDSYNLSSLIKTVDSVTSEVCQKHKGYRFLLTSLTTFITQHDEKTFLRLLQQFSQKRKTEGSLTFYILEDGLFDDRMYEAVSYLMDGAIHLRKTFTDNYIRIEGIGNARSREWIEMYPSETGYDLGSFTLERVR